MLYPNGPKYDKSNRGPCAATQRILAMGLVISNTNRGPMPYNNATSICRDLGPFAMHVCMLCACNMHTTCRDLNVFNACCM